jgi:hypothetical protein
VQSIRPLNRRNANLKKKIPRFRLKRKRKLVSLMSITRGAARQRPSDSRFTAPSARPRRKLTRRFSAEKKNKIRLAAPKHTRGSAAMTSRLRIHEGSCAKRAIEKKS